MKMTDKQRKAREGRISLICKNINDSKFGGENHDALTWLGSREVIPLERFSSGHPKIDDAMGGGYVKGRQHEIFGPESGGKSTLCLHAIAEHQKKYPDEEIALIDTEYSFDEEYAERIGVDREWLLVCQPDHGVQALNVALKLIQQNVGLIIFDSVAALVTQAELDGEMGDVHVATQARLMSQSLRTLNTEAGRRGTTIVWTNQLREKIGVTYGDRTTTPAGRALPHYASIRMSVRRVGAGEKEKIGGEDVIVSNLVEVMVKKNKTAPPYRRVKFHITFGHGIDMAAAILDSALSKKLVKKSGAWFVFEGNKYQGRAAILNAIREDSALSDSIKSMVDGDESAVQVVPESERTDDDDDYKVPEKKTSGKTIKKPKGNKEAVDVHDV